MDRAGGAFRDGVAERLTEALRRPEVARREGVRVAEREEAFMDAIGEKGVGPVQNWKSEQRVRTP